MADRIEGLDDLDSPEVSEELPEADGGKKKKKRARKQSKAGQNSGLTKILIKVAIGVGVIAAQIGVSYTVVTQVLMPKNEEVIETTDEGTEQPDLQSAPEEENEPETTASLNDTSEPLTSPLATYQLNDVVVNPALSGGKRYLAANLVYWFQDATMAELVAEREPMLRDRILGHLSAKPYTWFANHDNRNALKSEVIEITKEVLQINDGVQLFITKYVLQ